MAIAPRFWARVDRSGGPHACWPWTGALHSSGYGVLWGGRDDARRWLRAHRVAYELLVGPIPDGMQLDHLCRNRRCVNPAHLEPVTLVENVMRGVGVGPTNAAKTHCPRRHPLPERGGPRGRICLPCKRRRQQEWKARKAAA